jgi:hypothetical protein
VLSEFVIFNIVITGIGGLTMTQLAIANFSSRESIQEARLLSLCSVSGQITKPCLPIIELIRFSHGRGKSEVASMGEATRLI